MLVTLALSTVLAIEGCSHPTEAWSTWRAVALSDLDADGTPDVLVSVRARSVTDDFTCAISLPSGDVLWSRRGLAGTPLVVDDVDGDASPDVLLTRTGDSGLAVVVSGKSGETLVEIRGSDSGGLGSAAQLLDDLDGDGVRDLALGAPGGLDVEQRGEVAIVSAASGATLHTIAGALDDVRFGQALAWRGGPDRLYVFSEARVSAWSVGEAVSMLGSAELPAKPYTHKPRWIGEALEECLLVYGVPGGPLLAYGPHLQEVSSLPNPASGGFWRFRRRSDSEVATDGRSSSWTIRCDGQSADPVPDSIREVVAARGRAKAVSLSFEPFGDRGWIVVRNERHSPAPAPRRYGSVHVFAGSGAAAFVLDWQRLAALGAR